MTASDLIAAQLIAAEERIVKAWDDGAINGLTHFSLSQDGEHEQWLVHFYIGYIRPQDFVFASHRGHFHALLSGAYTPDELLERCLHGHSMALYGSQFFTSAIVAGSCSIAAGVALAAQQSGSGQRVFCFCGDGAEEEGGFAEAVHLVWNRDLPCTFIIEDNDGSCGVTQEQRKTTKRFSWPDCVIRARYRLKMPHAGSGAKMTLKSLVPAQS